MILIVDDNTLNRMILMKLIRRMGLHGYTATNGAEAVDFVRKKDDIELVLMDIMMPVMNGLDATLKIREFKKIEELPIVAVTADSTEGIKEKLEKAGCNDFVAKPIRKEIIENIIKKYIVVS
ncbi:MAG: hypothetical protein COA79_25495 [Planctomycetota bacterium]|nr:MAG: hypothetical protein COA79_25495 [Planctomycetota bacterium]